MLPSLQSLEWLKGSPESLTKKYKLCLLFQVNCPGCHSHAIPVANELYDMSLSSTTTSAGERPSPPLAAEVDVYAISTAFEDFEYNTVENTRLFLQEGRYVGVVQDRLGPTVASPQQIPPMPVAFDAVVPRDGATHKLQQLALKATQQNARQQLQEMMGLSSSPAAIERALAQLTVANALPAYLARVFYAVAAPGTPTWVLHDNTGRLLDRVFGQYTSNELVKWIERVIAKDSTGSSR